VFVGEVNDDVRGTSDGEVKSKSAYCHVSPMHNPKNFELDWHKNHGGLCIPKAVEAFLLHQTPVEKYLREYADLFDFCFRAKVPKSSRLEYRTEGVEILQNTTRYIVTNDGGSLIKVMPPLAKKPDQVREIGIAGGQTVTILNQMKKTHEIDINYSYYETEAYKLIQGVSKCVI